MKRWAVWIPHDAMAQLQIPRCMPGVQACACSDGIWLRGQELSQNHERQLRAIPGAHRYELAEGELLVPWGAKLPTGKLPHADWQALRDFLQPEFTTVSAPVGSVPRLVLGLARDERERTAAAMQTTLSAWRAYAERAPLVRLARLAFLANDHGAVFIIGTPLPPLAGRRFWEAEGLYVAAGYSWQPAVSAGTVRRVLGLHEDELAVWPEDGVWWRAERSQLVAATRTSVRATAEELARGTI